MRALFALLCLIAFSRAFAAPPCSLADKGVCPNPATQVCVGLEEGNGVGSCLSVLGGMCSLASDCAFGLTCSRSVCVTSGGCGQTPGMPNSPCTSPQVCLVVGGAGFCETVTGGLGSPCLVGTNFTLEATMSGACNSGFTCVGLQGEIGVCAALCTASTSSPGTLPSAGAPCTLSTGVLTGVSSSTTGNCFRANLEIVGSPLSPEFVCLAANAFSPFCVVQVGSSSSTGNPLCSGTQICVGEPGVGFGVCESGALGSPCFAGGEPCHAGLACLVDNPSTDFGHCERSGSSFFEGAMCDLNSNDPNSLNCGTGTSNPSLICVGFDDQGICVKNNNLNNIVIEGTTCSQGATRCTFDGNQCGPCGACLNGSSLACSSADSVCFCSCDVSNGGGSLLGSMCSASSSMTSNNWWASNMPSNMEPVSPQEQCGFCVQISAAGQSLQTACVASVNLFDMDDVCFRDEGRSDFQNQMWDMSGQHNKDFDFCRSQFCHPKTGLCVRGKRGEKCPMDDPDCCPGTCEDDGKGEGKNMCVRDCNQDNGNKGGKGGHGGKGGGGGKKGGGGGKGGNGGDQGQCPENHCYPDRKWENGQCNMGNKMDCSQFWSSGMIQQMGMHEECFSMECDENQGYQCMPNYSNHDGKSCNQDASMTGQTCQNGQCQGGNHRCDQSQGWSWNANAGRNGNGACTRHKQGPGHGGPQGPGNKNGGPGHGNGNKNGNNGDQGGYGGGNKNGNGDQGGHGNKNGNNGDQGGYGGGNKNGNGDNGNQGGYGGGGKNGGHGNKNGNGDQGGHGNKNGNYGNGNQGVYGGGPDMGSQSGPLSGGMPCVGPNC